MTDDTPSRRAFLRLGGVAGVVGVTGIAGCTALDGSVDPTMQSVMGVEGLSMFKGAPAHGEYPAEPQSLEMEGMSMNAVVVEMVAADDDSNNYHFMPHVAWVEPGTTVLWRHVDIPGTSEPRTHSVTSFGAGGQFPRLIPEAASHFDSGFIPGLHGVKKDEGIDERFNGRIAEDVGIGPFTHHFEEEGVYVYYCQNHHEYKMAGAVVVGELWGDDGAEAVSDPSGWSPAMTSEEADHIPEIDPVHGGPLLDQIHEVRTMVSSGGESMGHGMGGDEGGHGGDEGGGEEGDGHDEGGASTPTDGGHDEEGGH